MPKLCLIAAVAKNNVIGFENQLPWDLPEDLLYFMRTTWGLPCIMGAGTWRSIGRALPGRKCIVISTTLWDLEGAIVVESLEAALQEAALENPERVFVIGGETLYRAAIDQADELYITHIRAAYLGDRFFPKIRPEQWTLKSEAFKDQPLKQGNPLRYSFNVYHRAA